MWWNLQRCQCICIHSVYMPSIPVRQLSAVSFWILGLTKFIWDHQCSHVNISSHNDLMEHICGLYLLLRSLALSLAKVAAPAPLLVLENHCPSSSQQMGIYYARIHCQWYKLGSFNRLISCLYRCALMSINNTFGRRAAFISIIPYPPTKHKCF